MTDTQTNWTLVIKPKRHLLDLDLKEIWHYRDLITLFVRRDFVARYKQTILGPLWFVIQPLFTTIIYTFVFGRIAGISTDGLPQMLFYMSGIVGWNYFAACINGTAGTFTQNAAIFGKVYFPRLVTPISVVISNLVQFIIQFVFLLFFMVFFYMRGDVFTPTIYVLLVPFLIILLAALGLGMGIIVSSLTTKYRDLSNLVGFGVQLLMYATPVIYPVSALPDEYKIYILANPITPVIETFRYAMLGAGTVNYMHLLYSLGFTIVVLFIGIMLFNKVEKTFMDTV